MTRMLIAAQFATLTLVAIRKRNSGAIVVLHFFVLHCDDFVF
jgi:hypothetical protein